MPSFPEVVDRFASVALRCLVTASVIAAGCSPLPPPAGGSPPTSAAKECSVDGTISPQDADALANLRRTVEKGPLYAVSASKSAVASCVMKSESGERTLAYTFRDGGWMRVEYQPRIEYNDQEVRFASPLSEDPVPVLIRAEQAAFGAEGCGVNWRQPERRPPDDDASAIETIYVGDVCNCQARVRSDKSGRVMGLILRSAC